MTDPEQVIAEALHTAWMSQPGQPVPPWDHMATAAQKALTEAGFAVVPANEALTAEEARAILAMREKKYGPLDFAMADLGFDKLRAREQRGD